MKLFLSSMAISYSQGKHFLELVGKSRSQDVKIALIENAADVYEEGEKDWMYDNRNSIQAHQFKIDLVDIEDYRLEQRKGLLTRLEDADAIWLGGGNTYYLRWILRETRADTIISGLVRRGKVYGGGSAGALVAGPTIDFFQTADDPDDAPEIILEGLGLIKQVVVPHWQNEKYGSIMDDINNKLVKSGYETICITDEEAVSFNGTKFTIVR